MFARGPRRVRPGVDDLRDPFDFARQPDPMAGIFPSMAEPPREPGLPARWTEPEPGAPGTWSILDISAVRFFSIPAGFVAWISFAVLFGGDRPVPTWSLLVALPLALAVTVTIWRGYPWLLRRRWQRREARRKLRLEVAYRAFRDAQAQEDPAGMERMAQLVRKAQESEPLFSRAPSARA